MENYRILVVDDEPLLSQGLSQQIIEIWPGCSGLIEMAANGAEALALVENSCPDIIFLDIRMPEIDGMDLARRLTGFDTVPYIVFTTAYADHAVEAFEVNALDYLLKPISSERLKATLDRLSETIAKRDSEAGGERITPDVIEKVLSAMNLEPKKQFLDWIKASRQDNLHLVSVNDVQYFQAADKYTTVHTSDSEYIIRTSIKELCSQLDPAVFWQIHRGTLVNSHCIDVVTRDFAGRLNVSLKESDVSLSVSRNFRALFKQM